MTIPLRSTMAAIAAVSILAMAQLSVAKTQIQRPPPVVIDHSSGLVRLAALKALPKHTVVPIRGYSGKAFHIGVIEDAAGWNKVRVAGKLGALKITNWKRQMIVYAILDAQTNSLRFSSFTKRGTLGALTFDWSGIEPYYPTATPGVFAVVDRAGLRTIQFQQAIKGARPLGSISVR